MKDQRVDPGVPKVKTELSPKEVAPMEREMESLEKDFKEVEATYISRT